MAKKINKKYKTLKEYKEFVKKRLADFIPLLQKISMGDYSGEIEIPEEEDEFSELVTALHITLNELKVLEEERKKAEKARNAAELEKIKLLSKLKEELEEKVKERTRELQEKIKELEKFQKMAVGRELKMIELKREIEELKKKVEKNY
jgi:hypothetical protein